MNKVSDIRPEFPSEDAISAYGALSYLFMRSPRYVDWSVGMLRRVIQPPIDLKQTKIFYYDGYPRAACIWAHLNDSAEQQLLEGHFLRPAQWRSGPKLWLMEIIAPYEQGTGARAFRGFMKNIPDTIKNFRYMRIGADGRPKRVIESSRIHGKSWSAKVLPSIATKKELSNGN